MTLIYAILKGFLVLYEYSDKSITQERAIPKFIRRPLILEIQNSAKRMEEILSGQEDRFLVSLILKPFQDFLSIADKCTWHFLFYCRMLHSEFSRSIKLNPDLTTDDLFRILYQLNYNCNEFYRYFTEFIGKTAPDNYLNHLYFTRKKIRQCFVEPGLSLNPRHSSLSEMLEQWLKEEIDYVNRIQSLEQADSASHPRTHHCSRQPKVRANISVQELAYVFKAFEEDNLLEIEDHTIFFHAITQLFRTSGAENISVDSFRNKFYSPDSHCIKTMKDRLGKISKK